MNNHALIVDNCFQWATYIITLKKDEVSVENDNEISEYFDLPLSVNSEVISAICARPLSFRNISINRLNDSFYGWWISPWEYNRIKEQIQLKPQYDRYLELTKLPQ